MYYVFILFTNFLYETLKTYVHCCKHNWFGHLSHYVQKLIYTAHMLRLVGAFAIRICDKYQNFMLVQFVKNFSDTVMCEIGQIGFSIRCSNPYIR